MNKRRLLTLAKRAGLRINRNEDPVRPLKQLA